VKSSSSDEVLRELILELKNDPAVASISQPLDSPNGKTTIAAVTLNFSPQERETNRFLNKIYDNLSKIRDSDKGEQIYVGGLTPILYDFSTSLTKKLPGFILVVVLLSSILLMILFRSILIPIKAALMNLISILASFGIVVISFQWGWLTPLLGIGSGPIEPFLPIILFAILFGLSMDYEVFLVSRIQEEWLLCKDNEKAVRMGLANTGGVITAAALIMIVVFTAFIFTGDRTIQLFGVGLASAILIDATIIRSVLVPALMQSFGDKNWYLPKWLGKILPPVQLEKLE
jgi:RND superfamily putative drug exporter